MIELTGISKIFNHGRPNEFQALADIDLNLAARRITVFEGPSGSGKTTLLSIIGCMTRPTSGRIRLGGRDITSLSERSSAQIRRRTFGFIFQNYNLIKGLSVLENTMIPAYPEGIANRLLRSRAMDLLTKLEIDRRSGQLVEHLSGGEQQRVAIARALINNPDTIIADEPTAHLDTRLSEAFMRTMVALKSEAKTVLIASHDQLVCRSAYVDRRLSLRDGRIIAQELNAP